MSLKHHLINTPLPLDFWNYNTNPITGYKINDRIDIEWEERKYELRVKSLEI